MSTAYCSTQNIYDQFPRFVPNQPNSVQDSTVQDWINEAGAHIYAMFLARGITIPQNGLTPQQAAILSMLNRESGTKDLAQVLRYSTAAAGNDNFGAQSDAPKTPLPATRFRDGRFSEVMRGTYDRLFAPTTARTVSITPTIQGSIAGGDTDPSLATAASEGLNVHFTIRQPF